MSIIDGVFFTKNVLFAEEPDLKGYEEHNITRGRNPRPIMRKKTAKGWQYMEMDAYERLLKAKKEAEEAVKPPLTDAARMIADPHLDLSNYASRFILADALADEGRQQESDLLRSHIGEGMVAYGNRVVEPHDLPPAALMRTVVQEMNRLGGGWRDFAAFRDSPVYSPVGTMTVEYPATHESNNVPAAVIIAAARRLQHSPTGNVSRTQLETAMHNYRADVLVTTANKDEMSRVPPEIYWAHMRCSLSEKVTEDRIRGAGMFRLEVRSVPVLGGWHRRGYRERGYYTVIKRPLDSHALVECDQNESLFATATAAARDH